MKTHFRTLTILALGFAGLCLAFSHVNAGEVPFPQCPQKLNVQQSIQQNIQVPEVTGWKPVNRNGAAPLWGLGIASSDHITKGTGLDIPSGEKKLPGGDVIVYYDLPPASGGIHDYWAVCRYHETTVELVQKIPNQVRRCEIRIFNDHAAPEREMVKCYDTPRKTK